MCCGLRSRPKSEKKVVTDLLRDIMKVSVHPENLHTSSRLCEIRVQFLKPGQSVAKQIVIDLHTSTLKSKEISQLSQLPHALSYF